jgi:5-formyltetrahydrofolate cyclo-ligase
MKISQETTGKKKALREALLKARGVLDAGLRRQWDEAIGRQVCAWWSANPAPVLGVFWPIRSEPDLSAAYTELAARGARLALPVVAGRGLPLRFSSWTPGQEMVVDAFGIAAPAVAEWVAPDALLIPCVGFNAQRVRLGYGGGYYDRTLAQQPRPLAVGIAYACALAEFEAEPHDIGLDRIITELGSEYEPVPRNIRADFGRM